MVITLGFNLFYFFYNKEIEENRFNLGTALKKASARAMGTPRPGVTKFGNKSSLSLDLSSTGLPEEVLQDIEEAARHSLAIKTWASYNTAEKLLMIYHKEGKIKWELPVTEKVTLGFIHWLAFKRGIKASTIKNYLAGIRKLHIVKGFPEPNLNSEIVKMVLCGRSNIEAAERLRQGAGERQPVTRDILELIKIRLKCWSASEMDKLTVWLVCSLLFHGAFRGGELLSKRVGEFDPAFVLLRKDLAIVREGNGKETVQVKVKAPKERKDNRAIIIDVFQNDSKVCPVRAFRKWWSATRGFEQEQPAFRFESGKPVTLSAMNGLLKERLDGFLIGQRITTHSFRSGAASMMASLGFSEQEVKAVGRWSSNAVEKYVKLPRTKRMATAKKVQKYMMGN